MSKRNFSNIKIYIILILIIILFNILIGNFYFSRENLESEEDYYKDEDNSHFEQMGCFLSDVVEKNIKYNGYSINFQTPSCLKEQRLSSTEKILRSVDNQVSVYVGMRYLPFDDFLFEIRDTYITDEKSPYGNLVINDEQKMAVDGNEYTYIEVSYNPVVINEENEKVIIEYINYNKVYLIKELNEELIYLVIITTIDIDITRSFIRTFARTKIDTYEKKNVTYIEGDFIKGKLKQNIWDDFNSGYEVRFTIPNKYIEQDYSNNTYSHLNFLYKNTDTEELIEIMLYNNISMDNLFDFFRIRNYEDFKNREDYIDLSYTRPTKIISNDMDFYYSIIRKTNIGDGEATTYEDAYIIHQLNDNFIYIVNIKAINSTLNETVIRDFINIEVKEY